MVFWEIHELLKDGGLSEGDFCNLEGEFLMLKKWFSFSIPKWVCETSLSYIYTFGMILEIEDCTHLGT